MNAIKEFVYIQSNIYYNDNNIPYLAPFWSEDGRTLEIEEAQYDAWMKSDAMDLLTTEFSVVRAKTVKKFPKDTLGADLPDWYYKVYNAILSRAYAERWYHLIPDAIVVEIPSQNPDSDATKAHPELAKKIQQAMNESGLKPENGWFAKCSTCSTKHDYPPNPIFTGAEAVQHLYGSDEVIRAIHSGKATHIMLRPWLEEIERNNELRVFVRQGKVVGASQQACYGACAILTMFDENSVINACQRCFDDFNQKLPVKNRFDYECTFDAYISTDNEANVIVNLIEINSEMFGWGPAGASLFSWIYNPPPQPDEPPKFLIVGRF